MFFAGCASAPAPRATAQAAGHDESSTRAADEQPGASPLRKGMAAEEVRTLWGAPDAVKPFEAPSGQAEVWVYRRATVQQTLAANTTQTVQRFNPFYNHMVDVTEPVYGTVVTHTEVTTSLLFYEGKLVSWNQKREQDQTLDR